MKRGTHDDRAELQRAEFDLFAPRERPRGLTVTRADILRKIPVSKPYAPRLREVWVVACDMTDSAGTAFSRIAIAHVLDGRAFPAMFLGPVRVVDAVVDTLDLWVATQRSDDEAA